MKPLQTNPPPLYQINLSQPPEQRYNTICNDYKEEILCLLFLYDEILESTPFPRFFNFLAKHLLKVYSREEKREIKGISRVTGVPLHLVVAFNTFLDLFSACTSGGARIGDDDSSFEGSRIVHFRGLDWGMPVLRRLVIRVEYLREGKVIARGVTYAGYIGVLTGVRQGLSISLNYRISLSSPGTILKTFGHQLLVLTGFRPSISSHLRSLLLSGSSPPSLSNIQSLMSKTPTSPCYLTFCTPQEIMVIEKDIKSSIVETSSSFLAVTNHDRRMEAWDGVRWRMNLIRAGLYNTLQFLETSLERRALMERFWSTKMTKTSDAEHVEEGSSSGSMNTNWNVTLEDIQTWMEEYPIFNETTHFSCIMDPSAEGGGLLWVKSYS